MAAVPTTPPPAGVASFDTAALTSNFANMAGTNVAVEGVSSSYSRSAYSQNGGGGTVNVPGLKNTGNSKEESGWAGLSDGVHYAIYAGAAALAIMLLALTIWLCVRSSRKRKQEAARSNARMTSRSSFASPMHLRDGGHDSLSADSFKQVQPGITRTDTNYSANSMEKPRFGFGTDAQSVRSIPPAYTNHGNQSNVSLLSTQSQTSTVVHHQISKVNIGLSSFKPVPLDGLSSFKASEGVVKETGDDTDATKPETVSPKKKPSPLRQDSYPPSQQQPQRLYQEPRTPSSGRPHQQFNQNQQLPYASQPQHQQNQQRRSPPQAHRPRPSPNHQQSAQHPMQSPDYHPDRQQVPSSPGYLTAPRNIMPGQANANQGYFGYNRDYDDRGPISPVSPPARAPSAGGHRYRMPPQNRAQAQYQNQPLSPDSDGGYNGQNPAFGGRHQDSIGYSNSYSSFADNEGGGSVYQQQDRQYTGEEPYPQSQQQNIQYQHSGQGRANNYGNYHQY